MAQSRSTQSRSTQSRSTRSRSTQPRSSADIEELEARNAELMDEVDKYRTATEDALQQLDWCIGYFAASKHRGVAKSLGANRAYIRTRLLGRSEQSLPTNAKE